MSAIEMNIYPIKNLEQLSCNYWTYCIKGVSPDLEEYPKNLRYLASKLSNLTDSPCAPFRTDKGVFIAQPEGYDKLPSSLNLVRAAVKIEREPKPKLLNFNSLDPVTSGLAVRFLQGSIQRKLWNTFSLWQPKSGFPFYNKSPDQTFRTLSDDIDLYRGFAFRVVLLSDGRIGICVDVSSKYVSRFPLPTNISRDEFKAYKGMNCLYEYGNRWYEIRIEGLNDLNVTQLELPNGKSLFDDVREKAGSRKSYNLRALPRDCSVLIYYTSLGEPRNAPSGLCRLTFGTDHPNVQRFHYRTIKAPHIRRQEIAFEVNRYFRDLEFASIPIKLSRPIVVKEERFIVPDLEFGNNKVLSVRGTPNATNIPLHELPFKKKQLLYSDEAGFFNKKAFYRQYIILPRSVLESFGKHFINDIIQEVERACPLNEKPSYSPTTILYDDSVQRSVYKVGREIIKAVEENSANAGFGLVMIPRLPSKRMRKEDELANLVMQELRKRGIYVSTIHDTVSTESYEFIGNGKGSGDWAIVPDRKQQSKYRGYVRNVVLNKILLLNSFWPFVLKTPLNADLIIGIDVKNNTAGFTVVHKTGANITFYYSESKQKEQLGQSQLRKQILDIIRKEQEQLQFQNIQNIVIHRQGTLYPAERKGITQALKLLSKQGIISKNYQCTFVEIRSTSRLPFRLFRVLARPGIQKDWVENPIIGTYYKISENAAFICNTGPPFVYKGTTKPLHILKDGQLPLKTVLEDVFYLACLTWTKIDDCSRQPLSIKMADIRLREIAGQYDRDALRFEEEE